MTELSISPLLRFALRLDSVASALSGVLTIAAVGQASAWLGAPTIAMLAVGCFMLAYGVAIGWLSTRARVEFWAIWTVIVGNSIWVLASAILAASDWIDPTQLGMLVLLGQAFAVAIFAVLQFLGMRQSRLGLTL